MKTHWKLSENGWEYWGDIFITSKEMPTIKRTELGNYEMTVDGVVIVFDEEIVLADHPTEKGGAE